MKISREWSWDAEVAENFDKHVREQLPWYSLATGVVAHVARAYIPRGGTVIDVGASTGNIGRALRMTLEARGADFIAIDSSGEMPPRYDGPGSMVVTRAEEYDFGSAGPDLIICFLSLMFVPVAVRGDLIARMMSAIRYGGALIVFDKMVPRPGYIGTTAFRLALAAKMDAGALPAEVVAKELSISGIQRPLHEGELGEFVELFRFGDFTGRVWEKTEAW